MNFAIKPQNYLVYTSIRHIETKAFKVFIIVLVCDLLSPARQIVSHVLIDQERDPSRR
jgi:hypothetical protein